MDNFFLDARDPLFSILILLSTIFLIVGTNYILMLVKNRNSKKRFGHFLEELNNQKKTATFLEEMKKVSSKELFHLARLFFDHGDLDQTNNLCILLLNREQNYQNIDLDEVVFLLATTYYKLGLMARTVDCLHKILQNNPRHVDSLKFLIIVHEKMGKFGQALKITESLQEQKHFPKKDFAYLSIKKIIQNDNLSIRQKTNKLLKIYNQFHSFDREVFSFLFNNNLKIAWQNFDPSKCEKYLDLFYGLSRDKIIEKECKNISILSELYTAKGYFNWASSSSIFELDLLIALKKTSFDARLHFIYVCKNCHKTTPFVQSRCGFCYDLDSLHAKPLLKKSGLDAKESLL